MISLAATHAVAVGAAPPIYSGTPLAWVDGSLTCVWRSLGDGHTYRRIIGQIGTTRVSHEPIRPGEANVHWAPAISRTGKCAYFAGEWQSFVDGVRLQCEVNHDLAFDGENLYGLGALTSPRDGFDVLRFDATTGIAQVLVNARSYGGTYEQVEACIRDGIMVWMVCTHAGQRWQQGFYAGRIDGSGLVPFGGTTPSRFPVDAQARAFELYARDVAQGSECSWELDAAGELCALLATPVAAGLYGPPIDFPTRCNLRLFTKHELGLAIHTPPWPKVDGWSGTISRLWRAPSGQMFHLGIWPDPSAGERRDLHYRTLEANVFGVVPGSGVIDSWVDYRLDDGRLAVLAWERATGALRVLVLEEA